VSSPSSRIAVSVTPKYFQRREELPDRRRAGHAVADMACQIASNRLLSFALKTALFTEAQPRFDKPLPAT
jgi:hypothetical protein